MKTTSLPVAVAIVEDDLVFRNEWTAILTETEGFECVGAYGCLLEACRRLPKVQPRIVLINIHLGEGGSGIDCIRAARKQCPNTEFMMFTVFEEDEYIFEALKAGAKGFILKKSPIVKTLTAIRELDEGGSPASPYIARRVLGSFNPSDVASGLHFSKREQEILEALEKGLVYKEVAALLRLGAGTVKQYMHTIYGKLEAGNRTEAFNRYQRATSR